MQKGPSFLLQGVEHWPSQDFISLSTEEITKEAGSESAAMGVNSKPGGIGEAIDCTKFSSLDKLLRVTSYYQDLLTMSDFKLTKLK